MSDEPLILTVEFDPSSAQRFQTLRDQYFPPKLNIVPAHVTLFHQLPGTEFAAIETALQHICDRYPVMPFETSGLRFLGRGVAIEIDSPPLRKLRDELSALWHVYLTRQDQQPFRPHITIQNKADSGEAKRLYEMLKSTLTPQRGSIDGLSLWHYKNGPWALAKRFGFSSRDFNFGSSK
jgi:2'-5' RNA ligase